jgi:hypothetical protein
MTNKFAILLIAAAFGATSLHFASAYSKAPENYEQKDFRSQSNKPLKQDSKREYASTEATKTIQE